MTDLLDLKPPKVIDREAARTLHVRGIMILEQAFEAKVTRSLRRVLKSVSGNFGALVSAAGDPGEPVASFDDLAAINAGWATEVEETLIPLLLDTFASGAQNTSLSVAGVIDIPEFVHTQSVGWMVDAGNRLSRVSDEAWQAVREELTVGLTQGESIDQLQRRIRGTIDVVEARARTIARTEVIGAVNAGSYYEAKAMGVQTKTWLATDDRRTRPTHNAADDEMVGIDELFQVGGSMLRFPHDPAGAAKETVNCRCTLLYDNNDLCMCVPGWAQSETGERLVAAASSNCGCSGDTAVMAAEDLYSLAASKTDALSTDMQDALQNYKAVEYRNVNEKLRVTRGSLTNDDYRVNVDEDELSLRGELRPGSIRNLEIARDHTDRIDAAFDRTDPLGVEARVYRGVGNVRQTFGGDPVGVEFVDYGYVSSTTSKDVAGDFVRGDDPGFLSIRLPPNTKAINLSSAADRSVSERELLLDRGQRFRVTRAIKSDRGWEIEAELVP